MESNLSMEINEWWSSFDLIIKILIKDTIINLCDKNISPAKKEKYIKALRKKLMINK